MISPSVKNRMWALIIHPDSEGIDPQSLDGWDWRVGELLLHIQCRRSSTLLHTDVHFCMHVRNTKMHQRPEFLRCCASALECVGHIENKTCFSPLELLKDTLMA